MYQNNERDLISWAVLKADKEKGKTPQFLIVYTSDVHKIDTCCYVSDRIRTLGSKDK